MAKVKRGIGKVGKVITEPFCALGCWLVSEVAEAVEAVIILILWIVGAGVIIYSEYPYKTTARLVVTIVLVGFGTMILAGILMIFFKIMRYIIAALCMPFLLLNLGFTKLYENGYRQCYEKSGCRNIKFDDPVFIHRETAAQADMDPGWKAKWEYQKQAYEGYIERLKREKEEAEYRYEKMKTQNSRDTGNSSSDGSASYGGGKEQSKTNSRDKDVAYQEAMSLYMFSGSFSKEELKKQRNRLLKSFHPDEGDSQTLQYAQKINNAYEVLQRYAIG